MEIEKFIEEWIAASNAYDTEGYLTFYHDDAVLDDPSVGQKYAGKARIEKYFRDYFIGYQTNTQKVELIVKDQNHAWLLVEFTGDFPEGKLRGTFDFTFREDKISFVTADLRSE